MVKPLALLGGALVALILLDKKKPAEEPAKVVSAPSQPVVVNVTKRYVTTRPKPNTRRKPRTTPETPAPLPAEQPEETHTDPEEQSEES